MFSLLVSNVFADWIQQLLAELVHGCQCFIWMDILPGKLQERKADNSVRVISHPRQYHIRSAKSHQFRIFYRRPFCQLAAFTQDTFLDACCLISRKALFQIGKIRVLIQFPQNGLPFLIPFRIPHVIDIRDGFPVAFSRQDGDGTCMFSHRMPQFLPYLQRSNCRCCGWSMEKQVCLLHQIVLVILGHRPQKIQVPSLVAPKLGQKAMILNQHRIAINHPNPSYSRKVSIGTGYVLPYFMNRRFFSTSPANNVQNILYIIGTLL